MGKWYFSPGREEFERAAQTRKVASGLTGKSRALALKHADSVEMRGREKFEKAYAQLSKRDKKRLAK